MVAALRLAEVNVGDLSLTAETVQATARELRRHDVEGALKGARALYCGRGESYLLQIKVVLQCLEAFNKAADARRAR